MTRIAWLTDIHLNFLSDQEVDAFVDMIVETRADGILIGGDVGEAHDVLGYLALLDGALDRPIYFVLGNHDFYHGSIHRVRSQVNALCRERPNLHYLTSGGVSELAAGVGLVGHDGWADARLGDYERSMVMMNDYLLIEELAAYDKRGRWSALQSFGDEAALHIRQVLPTALNAYQRVMLLTHVPPWREACWHEGRISDDEWAPHFTCKAAGDTIVEVMRKHPGRQLTVLCGHTHGSGECRLFDNIHVLTGGAEYGHPEVQRVFEL